MLACCYTAVQARAVDVKVGQLKAAEARDLVKARATFDGFLPKAWDSAENNTGLCTWGEWFDGVRRNYTCGTLRDWPKCPLHSQTAIWKSINRFEVYPTG
jgi:hypothetical protein